MALVLVLRPPVNSTYLGITPGEIFKFDAVLDDNFKDSIKLSDHEVEEGADITDHARRELVTATMTAKFTELPVDGDTTARRHAAAYFQLLEILDTREPVTVVTPERVQSSMILKSISKSRSAKSGNAIEVDLEFREIRFATSVIVDVPPEILSPRAKNSGTSKVDAGAEPAVDLLADPDTFIGPPAPEATTATAKKSRLKGGAGILG